MEDNLTLPIAVSEFLFKISKEGSPDFLINF
jgi:hypothetical protein